MAWLFRLRLLLDQNVKRAEMHRALLLDALPTLLGRFGHADAFVYRLQIVPRSRLGAPIESLSRDNIAQLAHNGNFQWRALLPGVTSCPWSLA